jgi:hypothetical protein
MGDAQRALTPMKDHHVVREPATAHGPSPAHHRLWWCRLTRRQTNVLVLLSNCWMYIPRDEARIGSGMVEEIRKTVVS